MGSAAGSLLVTGAASACEAALSMLRGEGDVVVCCDHSVCCLCCVASDRLLEMRLRQDLAAAEAVAAAAARLREGMSRSASAPAAGCSPWKRA